MRTGQLGPFALGERGHDGGETRRTDGLELVYVQNPVMVEVVQVEAARTEHE